MLAAPHSGAGKTLVTMALLRALKERGMALAPFKAGPDYIDPGFHHMACGAPSFNLDMWGMRPEFLHQLTSVEQTGDSMIFVEAMMGLYDGAADGQASSAALAQALGLPVILLVDCAKMSHSIAPLIFGFQHFNKEKLIHGVILNKIGSKRHEMMLREALKPLDIAVVGAISHDSNLALPERHLGLVQAREQEDMEEFIAAAAKRIAAQVDMAYLCDIAATCNATTCSQMSVTKLPPLSGHMAIARDEAFCFIYPHLVKGWREQGAILSFFSPLANEAPPIEADSIFLPGGYPELHAARLASNDVFKAGMQVSAMAGKRIYGECGGYMMLGESLEDKQGTCHAMLGLLPLATRFKTRRLHLGYRHLQMVAGGVWGNTWPSKLRGHEFHYSTITYQGEATPLFQAHDARGENLSPFGQVRENIAGSFAHIIDLESVETR